MTVTTYQCLACGEDVEITKQPEHNDTCTGERFWYLSPASFEATREKVEKLNARAVKKGFTGRLELVYERMLVERDTAIGKVTEVVYMTRIDGEAPSYNGWTLLASLDFTDAGVIVNCAPGVKRVNRELIEQGKCDHCKHNRMRVKAYLVSDGTRQLQVGSTCLKDFLGWSMFPAYVSTDSVSDDIDGFLSGGSWPRTFATEDVLAAAWATIKVDGYVRASDWERTPTKSTVLAILDPPNNEKARREIRERYGSKVDENREVATKTREFILSDEFAGDSEYVQNMKIAVTSDAVLSKHFGLVVSAPQAWARHQEQTLIRERERSETVDEFLGTVKERLRNLKVRVKAIKYQASDFGSTVLYTLVTDKGHLIKWWASSEVLGSVIDEWFTIDGTVKAHNIWNGRKETILTRCKDKSE